MKHFGFMILTVALLGASATAKDVTITVNGESTISRQPDTAILSVSIVSANGVAQAATTDNNSRYNDLRNRLHAIGIEDSAIRTLSYNVGNYGPPQPLQGSVERAFMRPIPYPDQRGPGWTVTRPLQIKMTPDVVGQAIDAAVAANVSNLFNVGYSISNYRQLYAQALTEAVTDAQLQAKSMVQPAGMHIVKISAMQTGGNYGPPRIMRALSAPAPGKAGIPTEIQQPGPVDVHANVSVTYIIAP